MIDRKHCAGCHDDYYNSPATTEKGRCWSRKSGKMVWRIPVGLFEPPPYKDKKKIRVPSCWHDSKTGSSKTLMVDSKSLTSEGYWKS